MIRKLLLSTILFVLCFKGVAADYFIHSEGNDSNTGISNTQAWKTIGRINQQIFAPGDRIFFHAGDRFPGNLLLDQFDLTTNEKPIVISSYGNGKAVIDAGDATGFLLLNVSNIIIKNLIVTGSGRYTNKGSGVEFRNELENSKLLENISVDSVEVSGFGLYGIFVFGAGAGTENNFNGYNRVTLTRCTANNNLYVGIWIYGNYDWTSQKRYANKNVYIAYCKAFNNSGDYSYLEKHSGNGILVESTDGAIIERCIAYNNGFDCHSPNGGPVGIWTHASNNIIIQYNESHHNKTGSGSVDGGGFDFDAGVTNSIFQYNYSHDNDGAGFLLYVYKGGPYTFENNIVRYNISQNDGRKNRYSAVYVVNDGMNFRNIYVYNNTFYTAPSATGNPVVVKVSGTENVYLLNNIFLSKGNVPLLDIGSNKNLLIQNNNYWSYGDSAIVFSDSVRFSSIQEWSKSKRYEMNQNKITAKIVDPKLVNADEIRTINNPDSLQTLSSYLLRPGSPLIGAGIPVKRIVKPAEFDFTGLPLKLKKKSDIGACSFVNGKNQ